MENGPREFGLVAILKRRWIVLVALALLGTIAGAILTPVILRRQGTPERLRSKAPATEASSPNVVSEGEYRSENLRVQFRKPEPTGEEEETSGPAPRNDGLMY